MLKGFLKRIVAEAIKELIYPEFEKVYAKMEEEFEKVYAKMDEEFGRVYEKIEEESRRLNGRIDELREELRHIDRRLDDLYKVVVRREEHYSLVEDVKRLREDVEMLKRKVGV